MTNERASFNRVLGLKESVYPIFFELIAYSIFVFWLFSATFESMLAIWWRSDTYSHGFLIAPISAWLIWRQRNRLAGLCVVRCWPALLGVVLAGGAWLAGKLVDALVVQQFAVVLLWIFGAVYLLGLKVSKAMAFALLFLLFMVPVGEDLVGPMMHFTADFTVWLVKLSGIPVYREGLFFSLPTGNWSVVEACSGVRYLIASFCLGCLYAYLTFTHLSKRLLFVIFALLVPVLANGLRAYGIVMIGHFSDMSLATGIDHLIYGWLFFGLVMLALFSIGSLFRDLNLSDSDARGQDWNHFDSKAPTQDGSGLGSVYTGREHLLGSVGLVLLLVLWPLLAHNISTRPLPVAQAPLIAPLMAPLSAEISTPLPLLADKVSVQTPWLETNTLPVSLPQEKDDSKEMQGSKPWRQSLMASDTWRPASFSRDLELLSQSNVQAQNTGQIFLLEQDYQRENTQISIFVRYYLSQEIGRELINSGNRLLPVEQRQWRLSARDTYRVNLGGETWTLQQALIKHADRARLVWSWYHIGGLNTGNHYWAKLLEAYHQLSFGPRYASEITLVLDLTTDELDDLMVPQAQLMNFIEQVLPPLVQNFRRVSEGG